jgi:outer membrane biosynthesis protein TonB
MSSGIGLAILVAVLLGLASPAPSIADPSPSTKTPAPVESAKNPKVFENSEFSLNTYTWDWAPWMRSFMDQLEEKWEAPEAYASGGVSGTVVLKVTVTKAGSVAIVDVPDQETRLELVTASVDLVKRLSGLQPLPEHFPEEVLVLVMALKYVKQGQ